MAFMPDGAMDKVNEAALEFTTKFSGFMLLGFFEVAINMAKEKANAKVEDDPEQLLAIPVPDWTLKSGFLSKEGGNFHSWKKRFFVAKNKANDFTIEYYASEKCGEKELKGIINCSGYRCSKDISKKPHGIKLTPWDDERRPWYIVCEDAKEQDEWISVFENACWHAKPTGDKDPMIQEAFEVAFGKLKTDLGFWYSMQFDRSPAEMLTKLLVMHLDREILRDILAGVSTPGNLGISTARSAVRSIMVKACTAACTSAWAGSKPALDLAKAVVEEKVIPGIQPIIDAQIKLKEQIVGIVTSVATPVTDKLRDTVFSPLMAMVLGPMGDAFKAAIKGFHTQTTAKMESGLGLKDEKVYRDMVSNVSYSYYSASPMVEAYQVIRSLDETHLGTFCDAMPGISSWSFIYKFDSMLRDLLRRAIYTMHKLCGEDVDPAAALAKVIAQLVHDAKLCFQAIVAKGLMGMVGDFFDENLIQPCVDLVKPVSEAIPELLKTLLSVEGLLQEALTSIVENCIENCTSGASSGAAGTIDTWQG